MPRLTHHVKSSPTLPSSFSYSPSTKIESFPALLGSLKEIVGPNTLCVLSYKRRMDSREVPFFENLAEEFLVKVVSLASHPCSPYTETYIVLCYLRPSKHLLGTPTCS